MIESLKFDEKGLIPAVVQDCSSREVLMVAYMNEESLRLTQETGYTHFYSRSRQSLWKKGETSGNVQKVKEIRVDCDSDTLLMLVEPAGPACHTNHYSCFYTDFMSGKEIPMTAQNRGVLCDVYETIKNRVQYPVEGSYTNYLFEKGIDKMLKKVGEETSEVIIAAKNRVYSEVRYEVADLMYHLSVVLAEQNMTWDDIFDELRSREK